MEKSIYTQTDNWQEQIANLKPQLRQIIAQEWESEGFFPCYAVVNLRGDPTLHFADLIDFWRSRTDPFLKVATTLCWPFRLLQLVSKLERDGVSWPVPTDGQFAIRFHTFFTDYYFYATIRRFTTDPQLSSEEQARWRAVLADMVNLVLKNQITRSIDADEFSVFQFFPESELRLDPSSSGSRFLRWSGMAQIDPDADDTFVILEMLHDYLSGLPDNADASTQSVRDSLEQVLRRPYWKLLRFFQFRPDAVAQPEVNYLSVDSEGGITTWFGDFPADAPDLVVNVNVLRSVLLNRDHWHIFESEEAMATVRGMIDCLFRNTLSGLYRQDRAYGFYIAEFYCAMFGRLWQVVNTLSPAERQQLDPEGHLASIREAALDYLVNELNPVGQSLNPLDAALALSTAIQLDDVKPEFVDGWLRVIGQRFDAGYKAYEIFKGKIPTHMVYGSEATTAALVYDALDELDHYLNAQDKGQP